MGQGQGQCTEPAEEGKRSPGSVGEEPRKAAGE